MLPSEHGSSLRWKGKEITGHKKLKDLGINDGDNIELLNLLEMEKIDPDKEQGNKKEDTETIMEREQRVQNQQEEEKTKDKIPNLNNIKELWREIKHDISIDTWQSCQ